MLCKNFYTPVELRKYILYCTLSSAIIILPLERKIFRLLYFFNAMNTGCNVAVLLYIRHWF